MRKSILSVLISACSFSVYAQTYVQYDAQCMDRLEYRFLQPEPSNVSYTTYRVNKNQFEKLYLETGVENQVVSDVPSTLISCSDLQLTKDDIAAINQGASVVYLCKKLDSGWLIAPISSISYMNYDGTNLVYQGADFTLRANFSIPMAGQNLAENTGTNIVNIFYSGQIDACNQTASVFKKLPNATCNDEGTLTIIPSVGLVQNLCESGQKYELVNINGLPVCDFLAQNNAPMSVASNEPMPEKIPTQYSNQPLDDKTLTRADMFGEDLSSNPTSAALSAASTPSSNVYVEPTTTYVAPTNTNTIAATTTADCNVQPKEGEHVVNYGESLYAIARRYGIDVASLRTWNNLASDAIYPCNTIRITAPVQAEPQASMTEARTQDVPMSYVSKPKTDQAITAAPTTTAKPVVKATPKSDCTAKAKDGEHIVQKGESLYAIARLYNIKVDQIRTWNVLKSDVISPCQVLTVTEPQVGVKAVPSEYTMVVKPKSVTETTPTAVPKEDCMHVVKKGETLTKLAKEFGVKESDLRAFNNLGTSDKILVGQVLRKQSSPCFVEKELPKSYSNEVKLKVASKADDNTKAPAEPKVNTAPKKEDVPHEYSTIVMPKPIKVKENETTAKGVDLKARKYYIAKDSDTLQGIAKTYGLTTEKLRSLNNLTANESIVIGQLLLLE